MLWKKAERYKSGFIYMEAYSSNGILNSSRKKSNIIIEIVLVLQTYMLTVSFKILQLIFWFLIRSNDSVAFHNSEMRSLPGLGSNTFYQIQIQIQIQKFAFFKYKYKYKYFAQLWFKCKYKYKYINSNTNTNTNTLNQIYLPKLFGSKIGQFYQSQNICSWSVFPNV